MAELAADPGWVAARAEADAKMARLAEQRRRALQPVTLELRAVGFDVKSPWELHKHSPYPERFPSCFGIFGCPATRRSRERRSPRLWPFPRPATTGVRSSTCIGRRIRAKTDSCKPWPMSST